MLLKEMEKIKIQNNRFDMPSIIAGDFNSFPSSLLYRFYGSGKMDDCFCTSALAKEVSIALEDKYPSGVIKILK